MNIDTLYAAGIAIQVRCRRRVDGTVPTANAPQRQISPDERSICRARICSVVSMRLSAKSARTILKSMLTEVQGVSMRLSAKSARTRNTMPWLPVLTWSQCASAPNQPGQHNNRCSAQFPVLSQCASAPNQPGLCKPRSVPHLRVVSMRLSAKSARTLSTSFGRSTSTGVSMRLSAKSARTTQ